MKVGVISSIYEPDIGGPATYLRQFREELLREGHCVRIVTYGEVSSEAGIVRVPRRRPLPIRLGMFAAAVGRYLSGADVWFVNDYGFTAFLLKALLRKRAVMKIVGDWAWEYAVRSGQLRLPSEQRAGADTLRLLEDRRQPPLVEMRKAIRTLCARSMDEIIVPSSFLADVVAQWGIPRKRIHVIYNGVRDYAGEPQPERSERTTVLAVGRLIRSKGFDVLLRALAIVVREIPDAQVVLLGDGPERSRLETLARRLDLAGTNVHFAGHVNPERVRAELAKAHAFALPSAHEGLPHAVLEAMAAECPVVATEVGGVPEIIRHNIDGLLVPFGDPVALAAALLRILHDRGLANQLSREAKRRATQEFSWSRTRDSTISLLLETATRPPA
jgi:glycosyltransferase involved in cell wall biosynthesis